MNQRQKEALEAQLNSEKRTLNELRQVYRQAMKDCDEKIRELSMRTDLENLQSIIYQKRYQEVLKGQLGSVLDKLHTEEYATVADYLARCYEDGYIGTMYDIHGQGVPVICPIDQRQVVSAIQTHTKLSKPLYERLGEDVDSLRTSIRAEISRGVATGMTWNAIAGKIVKSFKNTPFNKAYNRAMRIARTEGHRIATEAASNAQYAAREKGADVLKQWDATLDGRTRPSHREVDGEIRELEETFSNGLQYPGDPKGTAAEVINCRCALLQRARWALDEDELNTLQERAEYFGLDKSTKFEEFREKYLQLSSDTDTIKINTDIQSQLQSIKDRLNGKRASVDDLKEAGQLVKKHIGEYQMTDAEKEYNIAYKQVMDMSALIRANKMSINDEYKEAYRRWKEAEQRVQNLETTHAKWLSNALSEIRQMGTKGIESDVSKHLGNSRSNVRRYVEDAYSYYPREWIEKSIAGGQLSPKKVKRGYYSDVMQEIAISGDGAKAVQTAIHELGHRFEKAVPEIRDAEEEFYKYRTSGEDLTWLGAGYRKEEKTRFDNFVNPYMGKDYGGSAYELVSMGFEYAFTHPDRLAKDPEMEAWILGILSLY